MANYNGPYEDIDWVIPPFEHGGDCPVIAAVKNDGIVKGAGWIEGSVAGAYYSANCHEGTKFILHHTDTHVTQWNLVNMASHPGSDGGNQQPITQRQPRTSPTYDTYANGTTRTAYYFVYTDIVENPDNTWNYQQTNYETQMFFISSDDAGCPPGTVYNPDTGTCDVLPGMVWDPDTGTYCNPDGFEILKNVQFTSIPDSTHADEWESDGVIYNQTSQSDFTTTDNIAHFGNDVCEYIKQPITLDNGEYRKNPTILYGVEFSYIDIRGASSDSKIVINVGGDVDVWDIERIQDELPLVNGVYSFHAGGDLARIELPVPSVTPGEFAIAEVWQMGNIILEVTKFGILGYIPCVESEILDIPATEEIIECTTVPCMPQYLYNQDLYRRQIVTFKTDIQGLIPQYLDKIMISHSALQWGEAGKVSARDTNTLTLSENLVDITDGKTIVFRDINGDISGAYGVSIVDEYTIQVLGMPDWVTVNTFYTIQEMATAKEFLVISVRPSGDDVTIECVNYDENIYKDGGC